MPRGRKPKPTQLHRLHNTFRPREHRQRMTEPAVSGDLSQPPAEFSEKQAEIWRHAVASAPWLKPTDAQILRTWTLACDRHQRAAQKQAQLDEHAELPMLIRDPRTGRAVISPYIKILSAAADQMLRAAAELGFSPTARARLQAGPAALPPPPDPSSPWARLRLLQGGRIDQASDQDDPPDQSA